MDLTFIQKSNLKHQADLFFLDDEMTLLQDFVKTNFPAVFPDLLISRVHLLNNRLVQLKLAHKAVATHANLHHNNFRLKNITFLKIENERIEDEINDLTKTFKTLKTEVLAYHKISVELNLTAAPKELKPN